MLLFWHLLTNWDFLVLAKELCKQAISHLQNVSLDVSLVSVGLVTARTNEQT